MQIVEHLSECVMFAFLLVCAGFDMKEKQIPTALIAGGFAAAFGRKAWQVWKGTAMLGDAGYSLLPGTLFLLLSFLTREKVGYGDGLLLLVLGLFVGFRSCLIDVCIGLICASAFALILIVFRKAQRNSEIPFVPFLAIGMGVGFFV